MSRPNPRDPVPPVLSAAAVHWLFQSDGSTWPAGSHCQVVYYLCSNGLRDALVKIAYCELRELRELSAEAPDAVAEFLIWLAATGLGRYEVSVRAVRDPMAYLRDRFRRFLRNYCRRRLRDLKHLKLCGSTGEDQQVADRSESNGVQFAEDAEFKRLVAEAIDSLPHNQQASVRLYLFDDLPIKEIAAQLGVDGETMKKRIQRARTALVDHPLLKSYDPCDSTARIRRPDPREDDR